MRATPASRKPSARPTIGSGPPPPNAALGFRISVECCGTKTKPSRSASGAQHRRTLMSKTEIARTEPIGLDVGTSRIVTARQVKDEIRYDTQLNAFVAIPYSRMTANVLRKE